MFVTPPLCHFRIKEVQLFGIDTVTTCRLTCQVYLLSICSLLEALSPECHPQHQETAGQDQQCHLHWAPLQNKIR